MKRLERNFRFRVVVYLRRKQPPRGKIALLTPLIRAIIVSVIFMLMISLFQLDKKNQHSHAHKLLGECLRPYNIAYREDMLVRGEHGKPALREYPDIRFNLSHADGIAACIVSEHECGIDCERVREYRPNVARRVFTPEELAVFESTSESERDLLFFRLWTLKEAFVKAVGRGLSYPMNTVGFSFADGCIVCSEQGWRFRQYVLRGGKFVVSVCEAIA